MGVFKLQDSPAVTQADPQWLQVYPGPQKHLLSVTWLALSDGGDFSGSGSEKIGTFLSVDPKKYPDGEELPWDRGSQLCGMIAEYERNHLQQVAGSKYR
jgi:hypothetical protein